MSKLNTAKANHDVTTHEGGRAFGHLTDVQNLRRAVLSCLLWENQFYEDGVTIADRIVEYGNMVPVNVLADLVIEARQDHNLRHVPLLLLSVLAGRAQGTSLVSDTIYKTISRADELSEFLCVYAQINGVTPDKVKSKMSAQVKKGLARAFGKFDAYQLAKYNRKGAITLKDVLFLTHPRPANDEQQKLWKNLVDGTLSAPDTWEVGLSGGEDKKETFTRLLKENKLGYMALLRNLRNMVEAGVDEKLVRDAIISGNKSKILPFRFIAAAKYAPRFDSALNDAMIESIKELPSLTGTTVVLVDVSYSMVGIKVSAKSDMDRMNAASALGASVNGDDVRVFSFSNAVVEVPNRMGLAGVDAIQNSQGNSGTRLRAAIEEINSKVKYDRIIVITDEQSQDGNGTPLAGSKAYLINVASNKNGVGYGAWTHIDGFSENVLKYIYELENVLD